MTHLYLLTIIIYILYCSILELPHIMCLSWRGSRRHCNFIFLSLSNNQHPCGLFFHIYCISHLIKDFLHSYSCFLSFLLRPPQHSDALWPYLSQLLQFSLKNLPILLLLFFYPVFNARTFSYDASFSCFFIPFSYVL